jgi:hypothetical protein
MMPLSPDDNQPRRLTLRVSAPTWRIAHRLACGRADGRIETLLEKWLNDLAEGETRPGCAEAGWTGAWLTTLPGPPLPPELLARTLPLNPDDETPRLRDDEVMGSAYGAYPWDGWEKYAVAHGVAAELAALGRLVIREAWQHGWPERLRSLCGWRDDGRRMLRLAQRKPALAEKRWTRLLDTDGGRYDPETGRVL